jgi:hypothetical protein
VLGKQSSKGEPSQAHHFPTFDVYAFATIVHWLYYGNIQSIAEDYKENDTCDTAHMVKVYCLCEKLQLRLHMDLAIELLEHGYSKSGSAPTIEDIDIAYSQTDQWSRLRIHMATWVGRRQRAPPQEYFMAGPWDGKRFAALTTKHPDLWRYLEKLCEDT